MAMLGGECSACCDDPCGGCKAPSWGSARRFVQSLASLNGTQYTGLSVDTGEVTNSAFAVEGGLFTGTRIHPSVGPSRGYIQATVVEQSDGGGCGYGSAQLYIPFGGYYLDDQGSRYRRAPLDDRYPSPPTDGSIVAVVPYSELKVHFNTLQHSLSPNIVVYPPEVGFRFWRQNTSKPLITSIRFGGKAITATPWDGVSEPTINNAIFGNSAEIFPSSNCKWRESTTDPRRVLSVPDANYRGPLEIDWAIFRQFIAGQDDNGDTIAGYALAESGTVTVQWDDMTEFEGGEDCNPGACCEVDGSCNIKPQCECDTENGAVFAGVGETCEACAYCTVPREGIIGSQVALSVLGVSVRPRPGINPSVFDGCSDAEIEDQLNFVHSKTFLFNFVDFRHIGVEIGQSPYWEGQHPSDIPTAEPRYDPTPAFLHVCESAGTFPDNSINLRAYSNKLPDLGCVTAQSGTVDSRFDFQVPFLYIENVMQRLVAGEQVEFTTAGSSYNVISGTGLNALFHSIRVEITGRLEIVTNPLP